MLFVQERRHRAGDGRATRHEPDLGDHVERANAVHVKDKGGVNSDVFIEFLKRLLVGATRPIFLIVDRGSGAQCQKDKAFVETLGRKLKAVLPAALFAGPQSR